MLLNLILNAYHAIQRGMSAETEKSISTSSIQIDAVKADDRLAVTVTDTGIGISEADLERIREPFYTTSEHEGLGLGLSICESIVRSHGGQLVIESQINVGTRITFDLPIQSVAEKSPAFKQTTFHKQEQR